jgi:hypothetical protein
MCLREKCLSMYYRGIIRTAAARMLVNVCLCTEKINNYLLRTLHRQLSIDYNNIE